MVNSNFQIKKKKLLWMSYIQRTIICKLLTCTQVKEINIFRFNSFEDLFNLFNTMFYPKSLAVKSREVDSLKTELSTKLTELGAKHAQELAAERENTLQVFV